MDYLHRILSQPPLLWGYFLAWARRQTWTLESPPLVAFHVGEKSAYTLASPNLTWDQNITDGWGKHCDQDSLAADRGKIGRVEVNVHGRPDLLWDSLHAFLDEVLPSETGSVPASVPGDDGSDPASLPGVFGSVPASVPGVIEALEDLSILRRQFEAWRLNTTENLDRNPRLYIYRRDCIGAYLIHQRHVYWVPEVPGPYLRSDPDEIVENASVLAEVQAFIHYPASQWRNPHHWNSVQEFLREIGDTTDAENH